MALGEAGASWQVCGARAREQGRCCSLCVWFADLCSAPSNQQLAAAPASPPVGVPEMLKSSVGFYFSLQRGGAREKKCRYGRGCVNSSGSLYI